MDPMHKLIDNIDYLLQSNNDDVNKVENIIVNMKEYNNLDSIEQELVMDCIKEKVSNKKNKNNDEVIVTTKKQFLVSGSNGFGYGNGNSKPEVKPEPETKSDYKQDFKPEYKPRYEKASYKKKEAEPTIFMKDLSGNTVTEGEAMSSRTQALILNQISNEEFKRREDIYEKIRAIELPEQRSPEWFAMRSGKITASDGGAVLGKNKHEPQYNFVLKKVLGSTFETALACYHGKKFEQVVTMMYEYKNDVHTEEFGLLGHPDYYFLGASPDGICSQYKRDMKTYSPLVGRMLEIKCPLMRKIKYSGDIKDNICPIYYWCQVQLQLECCNLDECDFIQCNIEEYKDRNEWLEDTNSEADFKSKKYGLERGVVIELLPSKLTEDDYTNGVVKDTTIYNLATFLYPPKIDMSLSELDNWILTEMSNLKPNLRVNRVIYWRLIENNCTLILRDRNWFADNLEALRTMWSYVEFLRLNMDVAEQWKNWIDSQPIKYNDKIMKKLIELIEIKKNPNSQSGGEKLLGVNPDQSINKTNQDIVETKSKKKPIVVDTSEQVDNTNTNTNTNIVSNKENEPFKIIKRAVKKELDIGKNTKSEEKNEMVGEKPGEQLDSKPEPEEKIKITRGKKKIVLEENTDLKLETELKPESKPKAKTKAESKQEIKPEIKQETKPENMNTTTIITPTNPNVEEDLVLPNIKRPKAV